MQVAWLILYDVLILYTNSYKNLQSCAEIQQGEVVCLTHFLAIFFSFIDLSSTFCL